MKQLKDSTKCSDFVLTENYYTNINDFIDRIQQFMITRAYQRKAHGKGYYVYNLPCAFDIETSSFKIQGQKQVCMYIWQFCINGVVVIGRTWNEFIQLVEALEDALELSDKNRLYVYVHNLSYEFQFMRKWFDWLEVFAVDSRKPIKALCTHGIEFKDSYILSGYSLEMTAKQLHTYHVKKQVGLLNYNKVHTSETKLTHDEILYCIYDVIVVSAYIREQMDDCGNIVKIPLTNTSRVRNYCREKCFYGFSKDENIRTQNKYDYNDLMHDLRLTPAEYKLWKMSFQGGFTHANPHHVKELLFGVGSYDFTSSYPYVMLSEKFPMGKGFKINLKSWDEYLKYKQMFFMVFYVKMTNVDPIIFADNPISYSRCVSCVNPILNNGRVVYADELIIACNQIDLDVYLKFYHCEHLEISNCYCYAMDYLPRNFILSILKLYNDKTKLKGVAGKEREYLHSKGMLNSCYGMCVTDIVRDEITYTDDWNEPIKADIDEMIDKYNKNRSRFLFFPWGCAVTSYSRKNLFTAIAECNEDYCYSDTDSVKILNAEKHRKYFDDYNKNVERKLRAVAEKYKIPFDYFKPKTIKGVEKLIGVWDYEGEYTAFKTLGAKRYMYFADNSLHTTIAGVSKNGAVNYLRHCYRVYRQTKLHNKDVSRETFIKYVFKLFDDGLSIPSDYTGKLTHTYIDDEMKGVVTDYKGKASVYYEKSGIHLSATSYDLSMSKQFLNFLRGVRYEGII